MATILHSDGNAFYASVELLHRPALRGKPVAVGGDVEARHGIILAMSREAKAYHIKVGMALWQARQLCPNLIVVHPNYHLYLRFARMAREIYAAYTNQIEPFGLDEAWLDVTGSVGLFGDGEAIAADIRRRSKEELGITMSVGVSFNKVFAKLGSDMKKPDATTVITRENFREKVWPLPVGDLLYVGPATKKKLERYGITTIGGLARTDINALQSMFGKVGGMLYSFANGLDTSPVAQMGEEGMIKSVGNSCTCPRDLVCDEDVKMVFYTLAESVAARMVEAGFECRTVVIHIRDNALFSFERQAKLTRPTNLVRELVQQAMALFGANYNLNRQKPIRSIGIRGADLVPAGTPAQLSIFQDETQRDKVATVERASRQIRELYGYFALQRTLFLQDRRLMGLDAQSENIIHPVGYNYAG